MATANKIIMSRDTSGMGGEDAAWFSFQPLYDVILAEQPGLPG
ncbi:hypothetical protein [Haliea sp.]